ncbi:actin [Striga asiatica]|uniref:Actin n=1 Tax=Striga asiatica TaxID=4170 RepID=A0A5A7PTT2_STRAF|nr:actin [Striga asiatica]
MEAVVVDAGTKFLKAGFAVPDQPPSMISGLELNSVAASFTLLIEIELDSEALSYTSLFFTLSVSMGRIGKRLRRRLLSRLSEATEPAVVDIGSKFLKYNHALPNLGPEGFDLPFEDLGRLKAVLVLSSQMKKIPEDEPLSYSALLASMDIDPVERGFIRDWDAIEDMLKHILYNNLGWEIGNEGQILFTEPLATPKCKYMLMHTLQLLQKGYIEYWEENTRSLIEIDMEQAVRENLVQLMFEKFNISGFYASEQAVLSLYAVGRISGCAVDIGHGKMGFDDDAISYSRYFGILNHNEAFDDDCSLMTLFVFLRILVLETDIASVIEGAVQHISSRRFEIGGSDLTNLFAQELRQSNPQLRLNLSDFEKLKERFACCAEDDVAYEKLLQACPEEQHTLPDGQVIKIGRERFTVGEALFEPSILNMEAHGVVEQLVRCISTVSTENHRQLLENTVLCGGTSTMPGFEERFQKEAALSSSAIRPCLVKPPEYMPDNLAKYSAWIGGAILAKVVFPQNQHVTRGEYDETGPSIVHRKCF